MQQSRLNPEEKEDHAGDNQALSSMVERNIRTLIQLRLKAEQGSIPSYISSRKGKML